MIRKTIHLIKKTEKQFLFFIFTGIFLGIAISVNESVFNNYLREGFDLTVAQRTFLEVPRELPGLLVFLVIGLLFRFGDVRIAAIANLVAAAGMFAMGIIPSNYYLMLLCVFTFSLGNHVYMPLSNSIGMSFAKDENVGRKLGLVNASNTASLVISSALLWLLFRFLHISFFTALTIGAIAFICASIFLLKMKSTQTVQIKTRFVFRKKYMLYYWLCFLFGARKQIFITFAPWVIVYVFKQSVSTMTILFFIISTLGIFVKPFIGYLIDTVGERVILMTEAVILVFVCLSYAFAADLFSGGITVVIVCICYIIDATLNAASFARATYLRKISVTQADISPTLSLGTSIDHIASMVIPLIGGFIWTSGGESGYRYVFIGGAVIALINIFSAARIETKRAN